MATGKTTQEASDSSGEHLTPEEFGAAAKALSVVDKLKLSQIETIKRRGTGYGQGQLLHEATCRTILGDRKCPRSVPVVAFLIMVMRSIAFHDREARKRMRAIHVVPKEGTAMSATAVVAGVDMGIYAAEELARQGMETVEDFLVLFQGDKEAQELITAWSAGLRGSDLREYMELDQAGVDRVSKRVKKKAQKHYPDGWKK